MLVGRLSFSLGRRLLLLPSVSSSSPSPTKKRFQTTSPPPPTPPPTPPPQQDKAREKQNESFCLSSVKRSDYPQYVCGIVLPRPLRRRIFALRALNIEISSIKDAAKTQENAQLRLGWWRESIDLVFKKGVALDRHPVLEELSLVHQEVRLSRAWFKRLFDTRSDDINNVPIMTLKDLEQHAEMSASSLLYLALECGDERESSSSSSPSPTPSASSCHDTSHAASHLGKAIGIATLLRGVPHHLKNKQNYLPHQLLAQHGVDLSRQVKEEDWQEFQNKLSDVVFEVATAAKNHLDIARGMSEKIPAAHRKFFLPAAYCEDYLLHLEKLNFDVLHPTLKRNTRLSTMWRVYYNYKCSQF